MCADAHRAWRRPPRYAERTSCRGDERAENASQCRGSAQALSPLEPYRTGYLQVSPLHEIYFEEGQPAWQARGVRARRTGAGADARSRRFFDPRHYRIVVFDQRGCGAAGPTRASSTIQPGISSPTWNSCANTSASSAGWSSAGRGLDARVAYAEAPALRRELVLRGIFMLRKWEIDWFYQAGANALFRPLGRLHRADSAT
jgi:proline iminopeptidase